MGWSFGPLCRLVWVVLVVHYGVFLYGSVFWSSVVVVVVV